MLNLLKVGRRKQTRMVVLQTRIAETVHFIGKLKNTWLNADY